VEADGTDEAGRVVEAGGAVYAGGAVEADLVNDGSDCLFKLMRVLTFGQVLSKKCVYGNSQRKLGDSGE
jgi:hypothetical protein